MDFPAIANITDSVLPDDAEDEKDQLTSHPKEGKYTST